jgi:hypothetical protein
VGQEHQECLGHQGRLRNNEFNFLPQPNINKEKTVERMDIYLFQII